jgi:hypothetical protein
VARPERRPRSGVVSTLGIVDRASVIKPEPRGSGISNATWAALTGFYEAGGATTANLLRPARDDWFAMSDAEFEHQVNEQVNAGTPCQ